MEYSYLSVSCALTTHSLFPWVVLFLNGFSALRKYSVISRLIVTFSVNMFITLQFKAAIVSALSVFQRGGGGSVSGYVLFSIPWHGNILIGYCFKASYFFTIQRQLSLCFVLVALICFMRIVSINYISMLFLGDIFLPCL